MISATAWRARTRTRATNAGQVGVSVAEGPEPQAVASGNATWGRCVGPAVDTVTLFALRFFGMGPGASGQVMTSGASRPRATLAKTRRHRRHDRVFRR
jgi:hypothetical protein